MIVRDGAILLLLTACGVPGAVRPAQAKAVPILHREDKLHKEIENLEAEWRTALV